MVIENRELPAGTKLVCKYKKRVHTCEVVETQEGKRFRLTDGRTFKSPSSAGMAVTGRVSCDGWKFWSRAGEAATEPGEEGAPARGAKAKPTTPKTVRQISKLPNQKGVAEGQTKWFCSACQHSFLVDGKDAPEACTEGHPREVEDRPDGL